MQKPTFRAQDIAPKVVLSKTPVSQNKITTERPIVLSKTTVKSTPVVKTPASSYLTGGAPTQAGTPYAARLQGNSQITPKTNARTSGGFSSGRSKTGTAVKRQDSQIASIGDLRRTEYAAAKTNDINRLTGNSIAWHNANDTEKQALFAENEAIRKKYGMTYNDFTGESFQRNQAGLVENLSKPVNAYVKTQENYDKQNPLTVAGHNTMAGLAGASGGLYKTLDFFLPDVVTPKSVQNWIDSAAENADSIKEKVRTYNYDRGGKVGGVVGDLYQGGIEMVPAAVLSLLTAGQSATAQAASAIANVNKGSIAKVIEGIAKSPAAWTSFARTVGNDYEQAKQNGASDAQAAVSAIISSGINAGIEIGGGVEALAGREASLKNILRSAGEEGMEEVKQGVVSALTQKGVFDKDAPYYSTTDDSAVINPVRMLQEYGSGALLGGVIGAGKAIGNKGFGSNVKPVQTEQGTIQTDLDQNKTAPVETEAVQNRGLNEVIAENHEAIKKTGILAEMTGNEFQGGGKKLVDQVTDFFKSLGNKVTRVGFGDVTLSRSGARDSISHGMGRNKAIAFTAVPSVIENGEIIDVQNNWKGRGYDTVTFGGQVKIGGADYDMGVIVKRYDNVENASKYYVHEVLLTDTENGTVSFKTGTLSGNPSDTAPFSIDSISQNQQNGNPPDIVRRSAASQALGSDGENIIYTKNNKSINQTLDNRLQLPALLSDDTLVAYSISQNQQNSNPLDIVQQGAESQALGQRSEANKVALAQRFAQLENDLRDAKMLLPGPIRDKRVAHITNQLDSVWQEMTGKTAQTSQSAEDVAESTNSVSELRAAWENKRIAKQQAETTKQELTLTVRDMQMAENAARSGMDSVQWDKADNPEQAYIYGSALRAERDADFPIREYFARRTGEMQSTAQEAANAIASYAKDKKLGVQYERETMERNIRDIFGKDHQDAAEEIIREYIAPIHTAVADGTRIKNAYRSRVKELNLTKQESALVQLRMEGETGGEAEYIKNNNINVTSEMNAKINHAAQVMREIYNELFDKINEVQIRNGQEPTMFRKNYAPHFTLDKPDTMIGKVRFALGLGKDSSLSLPTDIAGITEEFRPGKKWFGNLLQRKGEITDYDAVYGFDHYIETAADVITLTDSIQKLRVLEDEVRYTFSDEGVRDKIDEIRANAEYDALQKRQAMEDVWEDNQTNAQQLINDLKNQKQMGMGGFVTELRRYTDNLAGKKSKEDRGWETKLNRQVYQVTKNLEGRVAANMIALNPGSWLTNFIPLTQASGEVSTGNLLRGMKETVRSFVKDDGFKDASDFLTNRYGSERIDQTLTQKASAAAGAPMEWIDHITSQAIVRARTNQNIQNGMSFADAVANADEFTASLMADRSKGSMPTIFNATNPVTKVFTMFQLEVNNQLSYLFKDMPKAQAEKGVAAVAAAYTKVFIGAYLYNIAYKSVFGRDSALDPIGIIMDALGIGDDEDDKKKTGWDVAESLMASTAENLPFVGGVIGGGRVPISSALPDVGKMWNSLSSDAASEKKQDVLRKEVTKPLVYLLPPFGGGAIKKAAEGFATVRAGGSYAHDTNGNDILQFPVYNQKPTDYAKAMIAGKWSSAEAQNYVDSGFKGLSAAQTEVYNTLRDRYNADSKTVLDTIKALSGVESEKDADGNVLKSAKTIKREMLFGMEGLTISQKREIDRKLISGGETPKPASYNDRDSFMISVYVPESRKDAARETIKAGFTIDQFIEYNDMLRDAKNQDHVSNSAARQQVLQNIRNNTQLTGEKMSELVEHVLISDLGETRRDDWEDVYKGKISAGQYLEIAGKYSEIKEKYDDIDGIKSKAQRESTEFGKWVDSLPLDRDIKASIIDDFDYSNFVPATATPYRWDMLTSEDAKAVAPKLEASGMKIDTYNDIRDACSEFKADKDANGKTISGSKKTKVVNYIRGRDDLTPEQQNLMIQSYGYKVSSVSKKTASSSTTFKSLPTFKKLKGF